MMIILIGIGLLAFVLFWGLAIAHYLFGLGDGY